MRCIKQTGALAVILATGLALSGCFVIALAPWFGKGDRSFLPEILGSWQQQTKEERVAWTFTRAEVEFMGEKVEGYRVVITEKEGKPTEALAVMGRIDGREYLMFLAADEDWQFKPLAPAWFLVRLVRAEDRLELKPFNTDYLGKLRERHRLALDLRCLDDKQGLKGAEEGDSPCRSDIPVIVEEHQKLRDFLVRNQDDPELFSTAWTLLRKKTEAPAGESGAR